MMSKAQKTIITTIALCGVLIGIQTLYGQNIGKIEKNLPTRSERDSVRNSKPVDSYVYEHHKSWFATEQEPDWDKVKRDLENRYPAMNTDSLYHRARMMYFSLSGDDKSCIRELAYLGKTYGKRWNSGALTKRARNLIMHDFGYEADAMQLTQWALERSKTEEERIAIRRYTLSRILAKQGKRKKAMHYIAEDMASYNLERPYLSSTGGIKKGLMMKWALRDLFEIASGRGGWYGVGMREQYKGKVSFAEDLPVWKKIRDNYIQQAWPSHNADSLMHLGAMYYYDVTLKDFEAGSHPFETYIKQYGAKDAVSLYSYTYAFYMKSKDHPALRQKALYWCKEGLKQAEMEGTDQGKFWELYARLQYQSENWKQAYFGIYQALEHAPQDQHERLQEVLEKMKYFEREL